MKTGMSDVSAERTRRFGLRAGCRNRIKRTSRISHETTYRMASISACVRSEELIRLSSWKVGVLVRP